MMDRVRAELFEALEDVLEVLALLDPDEPDDVLQNEGPWLCHLDALPDLEEDGPPALLVREALLETRQGERLTGEPGQVEVSLLRGRIVPGHEVVVPHLRGEVGHDRRLHMRIDVTREEVVDLNAQIPERHHRGLHPRAVVANDTVLAPFA